MTFAYALPIHIIAFSHAKPIAGIKFAWAYNQDVDVYLRKQSYSLEVVTIDVMASDDRA